jgi:hypothetical protein
MQMHRSILRSAVAGFLILGMNTGVAYAQRETDRAAVRERAQDQPNMHEQIRERLAERLKRARTIVERLEKALSQIDRGERPDPGLLRDMDRAWGGEPGREADGPMRGQGRGPAVPPLGESDHAQVQPSLEEMRAFVDREVPWLATRLKRADAERPGSSEAMLRRAGPRIAEVMRRSKDDPAAARVLVEQFRLGADLVDASRRIRRAMAAGDMTQEQAKAAFRKLAQRHLEIRERLTRRELEHARKRIEELEKGLATDRQQRDAILDDMAERMFKRASHFGRPGDRPRDGRGRDEPRDGGSRRP